MHRIGRNTYYDWKNKIPMKILEFKRSRIGMIGNYARFRMGFSTKVLGQDPPKISEQIYLLHQLPLNLKQLLQGQGCSNGRVPLCPLLRSQLAHLRVDVPWVKRVALHCAMFTPQEGSLPRDLHGVLWM
jgi:hypothetical protein